MSTLARFDGERLDLVPGEPATWQLLITNASRVVEAYRFQPEGDLAGYATVEPAQLSLYPGTDGTVTITLAVPRGPGVRAGEVPFAVLVSPQEHPSQPAVPEGVVDVAGFVATEAELTPRTVPTRRRTRHSLAVDNRGNHPIRVRVDSDNPDDEMRVRCAPQALDIDPGEAAFCKVSARPVPMLWRGQAQTLPFWLALSAGRVPYGPLEEFDPEFADSERQPLEPVGGQVVQMPIFPRGTGKALAAAAACLAVLAVLWFALLKPTVQSAARQAVAKPVAEAKEQAQTAQKKAEQASQQASVAAGTAKKAQKVAKTEATARALAAGVEPFDRRLVVSAAPGDTERESVTVPDKKLVTVTDLVFESRGDFGSARLLRDGQVLISTRSENFRTLDQHFVSPIIFTEGQQISFEVTCGRPAARNDRCQNAIYISGTTQPKPPPPPPPSVAAPIPNLPSAGGPAPPAPALPPPPSPG